MISASTVRFQLLLSTAVVASLALPGGAVAQNLPEGSYPTSTSGNTMTVGLTNPRTVINWDTFNIGNGYTVDFDGPNTVQAVLNRVVGFNTDPPEVSNIDGNLTSDSFIQVFLINPAGIIFGNGANVDVGSFVASTLDVDDDDFLAGGALDSQAPGDPTLYYFFGSDLDTGITVEDGAQIETSSGSLMLLGAYVDVQTGGSVSGATDVGLVAGNQIRVPADPGSPLSFSIRAPTPVANAITIGGQVSGRNVTAFMETSDTATDALLLVSDSGSITATTDGGGDIILSIGARTESEGGITSSPGGIRNNGTLTASGSIVLSGEIASDSGTLFRPRFVENNGTIDAGDDVLMRAYEDVTNAGTIIAGNDVTLSAVATATFSAPATDVSVTNSGQITAGGDVLLSADLSVTGSAFSTETGLAGNVDITNSGTISADGNVTLSANFALSGFATDSAVASAPTVEIINSGTIDAGGDVLLTAFASASESGPAPEAHITNSGRITAGGDVTLSASAFGSDGIPSTEVQVTNSGSIVAGGTVWVGVYAGDITNSGDISGENVFLSAFASGASETEPNQIVNSGTIIALDDVGLFASSGDITNSGVISLGGNASLIALVGNITNSGVIGAGGDVEVFADGDILDSALAGSISGADVALSAGGSITAGTVTARDDIAIRAPGTVTTRSLTSGATIGGNGPVDVAGAADDLLEGVDLSGHDVDVDGSAIAAGVVRAIGTGSDIRLRAPVTASLQDLDFAAGGDITIDGPANGVDVAMDAGGTITAGNISARDDIALRAGETLDVGTLQSGVTVGSGAPVDQAGSADTLLGETLTGHDLFIQAAQIDRDQATANGTNSDLIVRATTGDLTIDNALAGGNVDLDAAQLVTIGTVEALAGDVTILADDLDILGSITGSQVSITNRSGGNAVTVLGDASPAGAFTLTGDEVNRINSTVLNVDSLDQNLLVGNVAFDNDVGSTRINLLGTARVDIIGEVDASGVTRTLQVGGTNGAADPNDPSTLAGIIRMAPMNSGGGRILLGNGSLDLRGAKIGVGLDDGFLQSLGLLAGGTPVSTQVVQQDWIGNLGSTLYGIPGGYADPIVISAGTITVTYADYALFQNTGTSSQPSGVNADVLQIISSGNDGNGFELFGTIDQVGGVGAALLVQPTAVSLRNSRVNGCLILTGGGCGGGGGLTDTPIEPTTFWPTDEPGPPNGDFGSSALDGAGVEFALQELVSTDEDEAFDFDSLVGTNNEGLLGVLEVDDANAPAQCAPDDKRQLCRTEEKPDAQ